MIKNLIKKSLKKIFLLSFVRDIYEKFFVRKHPLQKIKLVKDYNIIHLGTEYGGWSFVDEDNLKDSIIISAGLGEDASFDIEFASKYNAKVIIIDPTPRAIRHFERIVDSFGDLPEISYSKGGKQPIGAYDLSKIGKDNLILIKKALWDKNQFLKFYSPPNPNHVSHSITNYQNKYKENTSYIEVEAITIENLLKEINIEKNDIPLIKLDIEGSAMEVLIDFINKDFKPRQILVEIDELNMPCKKNFDRVTRINELLVQNNYELIKMNGRADFLYYRN